MPRIQVGIQVMMAFVASLLVLSTLLQLSGTTETVLRGLSTAEDSYAFSSAVEDPDSSRIFKPILDQLDGSRTASSDVKLSLLYDGGQICNGDFVPMLKAEHAPIVSITDSEKTKKNVYTWMLIDIDAPDPKDASHAPFLHAIVANIDHKKAPVSVVSYYPVTPPTGDHRYVSLVFEQQHVITKEDIQGYEITFKDNRSKFDVVAYARHQGLTYRTRSFFYSRPS